MAQDARHAIHPRAESRAFQHEEEAVIQSPRDEGPTRAVPQAAEEKHDDEIEVIARLRAAVAAERDVEVVAEPARQRDVPAPPEFLHRLRDVGMLKILEELKPEHLPEADRHVRVAR